LSTAQLVVLWYAALVIVGILLVRADTASGPGYLIGAVVTVAVVLIYSLRQHPGARKRVVTLAVVLPLLLIPLLVWGVLAMPEYLQRQKERVITKEQIELSDTGLQERSGTLYLVGRIRNKSPLAVVRLEIEISIYEGSQLVERHLTTVMKPVPPGEARQFEDLLYGLETPMFKDGKWDTRFTGAPGTVTAVGGFNFRIVKAVGVVPSGQ
jgi:hypothetical protein